jgi:hypothetical protein
MVGIKVVRQLSTLRGASAVHVYVESGAASCIMAPLA